MGLLERRLSPLTETVAMALAVAAHALAGGATATARELTVYRGAALHCFSDELAGRFRELIEAGRTDAPFYDGFLEEYRFLFGHCGIACPRRRSSTRCGARATSSGRRSSTGRPPRRRRGRPSGGPTWGVISRPMRAGSIGAWMRSPCSSPGRRGRGRRVMREARALDAVLQRGPVVLQRGAL